MERGVDPDLVPRTARQRLKDAYEARLREQEWRRKWPPVADTAEAWRDYIAHTANAAARAIGVKVLGAMVANLLDVMQWEVTILVTSVVAPEYSLPPQVYRGSQTLGDALLSLRPSLVSRPGTLKLQCWLRDPEKWLSLLHRPLSLLPSAPHLDAVLENMDADGHVSYTTPTPMTWILGYALRAYEMKLQWPPWHLDAVCPLNKKKLGVADDLDNAACAPAKLNNGADWLCGLRLANRRVVWCNAMSYLQNVQARSASRTNGSEAVYCPISAAVWINDTSNPVMMSSLMTAFCAAARALTTSPLPIIDVVSGEIDNSYSTVLLQ
jgi:hypothetical protein